MTLLKPQNHKYILVVIRHKYRSSFTDKLYENKLISKIILCVQVELFWTYVRNQKRLVILTNYFLRVRQLIEECKNFKIFKVFLNVHRLNHGYVATLQLPQYFFHIRSNKATIFKKFYINCFKRFFFVFANSS